MRPPDLGVILSIWCAGLGAGAAIVAAWKVARPGYIRLAAGIVALLGLLAALAGGGSLALLAAAAATYAAIRPQGALAISALSATALAGHLAATTSGNAGWISVTVGALSLGAISSEMLLGHWFLVDPKLPRQPLRRLAIAGVVGALAEAAHLLVLPATTLLTFKFLLAALSGFAALLMVAVVLSLRGKSYAAVMAATGLSYLATLLALSVAILARPAVSGL